MSALTVDIRAEKLVAQILGAEQRLRDGLRQSLLRLAITAQSRVKADKLTGQVLHVRSGTLRRSINQRVEVDDTSIRAIVGTNVIYARVHEYGFEGDVNVRAHGRMAKGGSGIISVGAHVRKMNMPERSYLRSTLLEMQGEIQTTLRGAALRAVRQQ